MRAQRVAGGARKLDLVLVAARCDPANGRLINARGYERTGDVWSDVRIFGREALVGHLHARRRVAVGRPRDLPGDFEVFGLVRWNPRTGSGVLTIDGRVTPGEDLGLPAY